MSAARLLLVLAPVTLGLALPAPASADPSQLHIHVKEADGPGLDLTLPFALTELAPEEVLADMDVDVDLDDHRADIQRLRAAWKALKQLPEGERLLVEDEDVRLEMTRIGRRVHVYVTEEDGERVLIDLPHALVDTLLSGSDDRLRVGPALRSLGEEADGGWIEIRSDGDQVRIWTS